MKFVILFSILFGPVLLKSQPVSKFHSTDSLARAYSEMAQAKKFDTVYSTLLLEGNKTAKISFLKTGNEIKLIVVEENSKENTTVYYLKDNSLVLVEMFSNSDSNTLDQSVYFMSNKAYLKQKNSIKEVSDKYWLIKMDIYKATFADKSKK